MNRTEGFKGRICSYLEVLKKKIIGNMDEFWRFNVKWNKVGIKGYIVLFYYY